MDPKQGLPPFGRGWTRRTLLWSGGLLAVGALGAATGIGTGRWLRGWGRPTPPAWEMPLRPPIFGAHRGGAAIFPEHTLAAYGGAHDQYGCRFMELDVRSTRDGVPVVIHDATVDRTTDGKGYVSEFQLTDLQRLDAGYRFHGPDGKSWAGRGLRVPTLGEVLRRFPDSLFSIELKEADPGRDAAVVETIRSAKVERRVLLGSMRDEVISRVQALAPEIPTFYSFRSGLLLLAAHYVGLARWYRPTHNALLIPNRLFGLDYIGHSTIQTAHGLRLPVLVWTVNAVEEMKHLLEMGVDGIITDRPDLLAAAAATRHAGHGQLAHTPDGSESSANEYFLTVEPSSRGRLDT